MEFKDQIAIIGIGVTFLVSCANLIYSLWSSKRAMFVNTVTASRLKWIDSLRDKASEFIAVTSCLLVMDLSHDESSQTTLLLQRDTLLHQIVLHLNPHDAEDKKIRALVEHVRELMGKDGVSTEISESLLHLRDATGNYLKKEWTRVKEESSGHLR
jgi:hypothetical protein